MYATLTPPSNTALKLFERAQNSFSEKLLQKLTGQPARLQQLDADTAALPTHYQHYLGLRTVAIEQICGTESRSDDFDRHFHLLRQHTKSRWMSIAFARLNGEALPPVTLIKVGDRYYVRDGHHRISVARTLGEAFIEAEVIEIKTI